MPKLTFFIGKGGVGKTTISSAYAVFTALRRPRERILLLSTDPAHSLADVLETKLTDTPRRIALHRPGQLFAWQINPEKQFQAFLKPARNEILDLIESGTLFSRSEIEPLLDTTLPGMAEIASLLALHELLTTKAGEHAYDHIIVDTAPIGHTLRLFQLPEHFSRFLDFLDLAGSRDRWLAQRFGGRGIIAHTFLERWEQTVGEIKSALDAEHSSLVLVTSAESFSLNEAARSMIALKESTPNLSVSTIVLNRIVRPDAEKPASRAKVHCARCLSRSRMAHQARTFLRKEYPSLPVLLGEDPGHPIMGPRMLAAFGHHVFEQTKLPVKPAGRVVKETPPALSPASWPAIETPLAFTVGKGGVGKTTVSAALAFHQRTIRRKGLVTICSTDPAPSLDDVFETDVSGEPGAVLGDSKLEAVEVDSVAEFRAWAHSVQHKIDAAFSTESGGIHVDLSFDREVFSALLDIVPPGVDEIFAIFKIMELTAKKETTVILDMAPTGHALELLRMPERMLLWSRLLLKSLAAHRTLPLAQDVAVEIATLGQRVRELVQTLQQREHSRAFVVLLPEPIPYSQTGRLLEALHGLKAQVDALFVNRMLIEKTNCVRCEGARRGQVAMLESIRKKYRKSTIYVVEEFAGEVAGKKALQEFTKRLWQLA